MSSKNHLEVSFSADINHVEIDESQRQSSVVVGGEVDSAEREDREPAEGNYLAWVGNHDDTDHSRLLAYTTRLVQSGATATEMADDEESCSHHDRDNEDKDNNLDPLRRHSSHHILTVWKQASGVVDIGEMGGTTLQDESKQGIDNEEHDESCSGDDEESFVSNSQSADSVDSAIEMEKSIMFGIAFWVLMQQAMKYASVLHGKCCNFLMKCIKKCCKRFNNDETEPKDGADLMDNGAENGNTNSTSRTTQQTGTATAVAVMASMGGASAAAGAAAGATTAAATSATAAGASAVAASATTVAAVATAAAITASLVSTVVRQQQATVPRVTINETSPLANHALFEPPPCALNGQMKMGYVELKFEDMDSSKIGPMQEELEILFRQVYNEITAMCLDPFQRIMFSANMTGFYSENITTFARMPPSSMEPATDV
ncbi:expressed unknown protein [Seminavis robusta]|uniref:Uncharacterized protein n=1 Tax=Seminavis robusta TaxID=568900 RepID=A0A9N8HFJ3_9STRA|nr:expressed unknown protein [Seminavis robusta]|eukprot:Sro459_g147250.1 n/a (431) ;mRNA; f:18553-19940